MSDYEPGDTMVEALRRANPVPEGAAVSRRSLPSAHALFADIVTQRPRRVRRRVLLVAVVLALIAAMLMAFVAVRRVGTSLSIAPVCYESASLSAPSVVAIAGDPRQACAPFWIDGRFGTSVPDFDVCVLPSGVLAVFPGESGSVCSKLDLAESSGDNRIERFVDALDRQISGACVGSARAQQIISDEIRSRGLDGWKLKAGDRETDANRPCASIYVNAPARTVSVIPIADPQTTVPATGP